MWCACDANASPDGWRRRVGRTRRRPVASSRSAPSRVRPEMAEAFRCSAPDKWTQCWLWHYVKERCFLN